MTHVVLLGDSIFDNGAYTSGGPDVVTQLRSLVSVSWTATLLAADGARIDDVARQVERLPSDASHLVLSVGGNDALAHSELLEAPLLPPLSFWASWPTRPTASTLFQGRGQNCRRNHTGFKCLFPPFHAGFTKAR